MRRGLLTVSYIVAVAATAAAQQPASGQAVFDRACASCHDGGAGAPTPAALRQMAPDAILNALVNGRMQVQGSTLTDAERRAVAEFLAGQAPGGSTAPVAVAARCSTSPAMTDPDAPGSWNGWGNGPASTRYAKSGGLTAADLPRLTLKWAFGYQGVAAARAQPTLAGGRLFVASENGEVHSLDPKTG